jgi:hypothetical protein
MLACCNRDPEIVRRDVVVTSLKSCPVGPSAYSVMYGSGDFDTPATSFQFLHDVGREMSALPVTTRTIVVDVSEGDSSWRGIGSVAPNGPTSILVWQPNQACAFSQNVEQRTDSAFGVFGSRFITVGGRANAGTPHTFVGDLSTGIIMQLPFGLGAPHVRPTVTAFGSGALVAGGSNPDSNAALASAETYDPVIGDFDQTPIALSTPRMQHGAVVLANGDTLLIGGTDGTGLLRTMEIIEVGKRRFRTAGVASLTVPRLSPTVLRLANGEILVAGGTDAQGNAIPTLEWFSSDASKATKRPADLVTGAERAFVPLEAGGALAVIRPQTPTADFKTVWVISADGTLESADPIDATTLQTVRLYRGASGAPIVWTGATWLRWSPWDGNFELLPDAPETGPSLDAIDSGDSGLALWLEANGDGELVKGFRFAAESPYAPVSNPLAQLAPDRLAGIGTGTLRLDQSGLTLAAGTSAFVTDATFADFELDVDITAAPPLVVVRDEQGVELEVGGATCGFGQNAMRSLKVTRKGRQVSVVADAGPTHPCPVLLDEGVRVSLGLRGAQLPTDGGVTNLRIVRK